VSKATASRSRASSGGAGFTTSNFAEYIWLRDSRNMATLHCSKGTLKSVALQVPVLIITLASSLYTSNRAGARECVSGTSHIQVAEIAAA